MDETLQDALLRIREKTYVNAELLYVQLQRRNNLSSDEVAIIKSVITPTEKLTKVFECLANNHGEEIFVELQKISKRHFGPLYDAIRKELNDIGRTDLLLDESDKKNLSSIASSARQNAATSAIENDVSGQKISPDKQHLLKRAFMDNSMIDLILYIPYLEMSGHLTYDEVEIISQKPTLSGRQVALMNHLCSKTMDALRQLEVIARKNGHVHFANDLKDILEKP